MKALIIALALFGASQVFALDHAKKHAAPKDCNPYLVDNQYDSGHYVYPCGEAYTVTYRGCNEGEIGSFPTGEQGTSEGGNPESLRTCHNGTFYPNTNKKGDVKHRSCIEGEIGYFPTGYQNGGEGGNPESQRVCHHGRFVRMN